MDWVALGLDDDEPVTGMDEHDVGLAVTLASLSQRLPGYGLEDPPWGGELLEGPVHRLLRG